MTSGILVVSGGALVDGYSVKTLLLSPILVEYAANLFRAIVLSSGAMSITPIKQCSTPQSAYHFYVRLTRSF